MGASQRRKGQTGELEAAKVLPGAQKISKMYVPGPDLLWNNYYVEVKRRRDMYQSMNTIAAYLDTDSQIYMTRLDRKGWLVVMAPDTLLDMLDDAYTRGRTGQPQWET